MLFRKTIEDVEFEYPDIRYVIIFFLVAFVIVFLIFKDDFLLSIDPYQQNKEFTKRNYEMEFFGKVEEKGIDKENHSAPFVRFRNSKEKIYGRQEDFIDAISIGDSVAKSRNSKLLFVFKRDTILRIDFEEIHRRNDSVIKSKERKF